MFKLLITIFVISLSFSANAALTNCFSLQVKGMEDMNMMMSTLNREKAIAYKIISEGDRKSREVTFHVKAIGEKFAAKLYNKLTNVAGSFQRYVQVEASEFHYGEDACALYDNAESDF